MFSFGLIGAWMRHPGPRRQEVTSLDIVNCQHDFYQSILCILWTAVMLSSFRRNQLLEYMDSIVFPTAGPFSTLERTRKSISRASNGVGNLRSAGYYHRVQPTATGPTSAIMLFGAATSERSRLRLALQENRHPPRRELDPIKHLNHKVVLCSI